LRPHSWLGAEQDQKTDVTADRRNWLEADSRPDVGLRCRARRWPQSAVDALPGGQAPLVWRSV